MPWSGCSRRVTSAGWSAPRRWTASSITTPVLVFAIAFGLSMDYEVFLLGRIAEWWRRTGDNDLAVARGLQSTARVVTAAALLMSVVFAGFVAGGFSPVKQVGFGLVLIVLVDATLVRMLLVPAVMSLMGRANWWAPAPLRRLHDRFGVSDEPVRAAGPDLRPGDEDAASCNGPAGRGRRAGLTDVGSDHRDGVAVDHEGLTVPKGDVRHSGSSCTSRPRGRAPRSRGAPASGRAARSRDRGRRARQSWARRRAGGSPRWRRRTAPGPAGTGPARTDRRCTRRRRRRPGPVPRR